MSGYKFHSDDDLGHRDNGLNQELGGINDMLNKEELKKKELPQMRGDVQGRIKSNLCEKGEKCGLVENKECDGKGCH